MVTKKPTPKKMPKMPTEGSKHEKMEKDMEKKPKGGKC